MPRNIRLFYISKIREVGKKYVWSQECHHILLTKTSYNIHLFYPVYIYVAVDTDEAGIQTPGYQW
jgi:hypothetical protein